MGRRPAPDALEERIVGKFGEMTARQQEIARVILQDRLSAAWASADALGQRVGVDATTVVRFAQFLGYQGWVELREAVRHEVPRLLTAVEKLSNEASMHGSHQTVLRDVVARDMRNVQETAIINSPETIDRVIQLIAGAARVFVVGGGMESWLGDNLAMQLQRAGLDIRRVPEGKVSAALALADAREGDVVLGLALHRYITDAARMLASARNSQAHTVAITDSKLAPAAQMAEIVLVATDDSPILPHSMTGVLSLINVVVTGVTIARSRVARRYVSRVDSLFRDWDLLKP